MEWLERGLLVLAIGLAVLVAWALLATASRLARLRLRRTSLELVPRESLPAGVLATLDSGAPLMRTLGFERRYTAMSQRTVVAKDTTPIYTDVYEDAQGRAHALVSPSQAPGQGEFCNIMWATQLADGQALVTVNCHLHTLLCETPGWRMHDDYLPDAAQAWQRHLERVAAADKVIANDGVDFFRASKAATEMLITACESKGLVLRDGEYWRIPWRVALPFAWRLFRGQRRVAKVRADARPTASAAGPVNAPSVAPASAVDADIHAFEQQLAVLRATRWSRQKKLKVFLATAVLFLAVGSLWISWTFLPVLLAVIALHEGGHFLAMKLTGYSNLSVFFLPGLGGLASGEKANAGPWEKLFVSLAGPVPGILLALAGLMAQAAGVFDPAPWFQEFLLVCLFINYLNLLPVTPLDGGRVVEALLFARMPVARFLFAAVGVAAFAAFGVGTGDNVILVVALLLAFALPHQWRVMRLDRAIPRLPGETVDERGAVERLFRAMQQPRFARWPFQTRAAAATTLLPQLQGRRARAVECAGGIAIYAACLMAPLAAAAIAVPHFLGFAALAYSGYGIVRDDVDAEPAASPQAPARDWYAEAARVDSLPEAQRLDVLLAAAAHAQDLDEGEKAKELLEAAWRIAQQRPPQDPARARTLLALGRNSETPDQRQRWLRQLVDEMQSTGERGSLLLLAEAKERLAWEDGLPESGRTALLRDVVAHRELALPADSHELLGARRALAGALDKEGQPHQAEALLRQSIDSLALPLPADRSLKALQRRVLHLDAHVELAWFLTAHARPQEAAAVLEPALALVPARVSMSWDQPNRQAREAQLWAHLAYAEPQRVKESWQRYEESRKSIGGSAGPLLQHELDRLVVAGVAREEGWKQEAEGQIRKALKTRSGGFVRTRLCGQQEAPGSWRARQREARSAAARAAGVCAST